MRNLLNTIVAIRKSHMTIHVYPLKLFSFCAVVEEWGDGESYVASLKKTAGFILGPTTLHNRIIFSGGREIRL